MSRRWSAVVILASSVFIGLAFLFQDIRTPNAVLWQPVASAAPDLQRAEGLVLQEVRDGVIWANDGFSVYRSEGDGGFLKVYTVTPSLHFTWLAHSRLMRRLFGYEEAIEVFPLGGDRLLVFVGCEVQRIDLATGEAEQVHRRRYCGPSEGRGVLPFGVTTDPDGHIYYGEYVTRRMEKGETIALFRSDEEGRNFEIVYAFPTPTVRHIHAVQWDPYANVLWMGTGDGAEQSRIGFSRDRGETFLWIGQDSEDFRTVNLVFSEDHVDWLSDTVRIPARAHRWHRRNWGVESSSEALPGHGFFMQSIGDGYSLGSTAEEVASLWLIGPELGLNKIMEWEKGPPGFRGFGTIRLARGALEDSDWLYLSPLRVKEDGPSIYRLSRQTAFAAAGVPAPDQPRLISRDDR